MGGEKLKRTSTGRLMLGRMAENDVAVAASNYTKALEQNDGKDDQEGLGVIDGTVSNFRDLIDTTALDGGSDRLGSNALRNSSSVVSSRFHRLRLK